MVAPMNKVHKLKSWSMFFQDIVSGERTSDIRSTEDRDFRVGDILELEEFNPVKFTYTGRVQNVIITYIQQNKSNPCAISRDALRDDYAVLSIKTVGSVRAREVVSEDKVSEDDYKKGRQKFIDDFVKEESERTKQQRPLSIGPGTIPLYPGPPIIYTDVAGLPARFPNYIRNKGWDGD